MIVTTEDSSYYVPPTYIGDTPDYIIPSDKTPVFVTDKTVETPSKSQVFTSSSKKSLGLSDSIVYDTLTNLTECIVYYAKEKSLTLMESTKLLNRVLNDLLTCKD